MASREEIRQTRLEKLELLKKAGTNPYPAESHRTHAISDLLNEDTFKSASEKNEVVTIAGRIMSLRPQGGLVFFHVYDGTGKFQGLLKQEELDATLWDLFEKTVDIGDFIEITGSLFVTKRGEKTVTVKAWRMLSKSLLPLPEKWHGLQDADEKLRHRYLDILFNPEIKELIEKKALFWDFIRTYLKKAGFIEVETPTLELTTGGAEANPFKTHHKDFDLDVFLRISVGELWQKRLLAAGMVKTFEIGRTYRNEGTSPEHAQEFTNLEFYAAYMDYKQGIEFTEIMLRELVKSVFGKTTFTSRGFTFDFGSEKWPQIDYVETVEKMTGIHILKATEDEMKAKLTELNVEYEGKNRERLIDTLWKYCRKQISGPAWLMHHPKIVSPLSKEMKDNPELTERVQLILAGAEVTNGFSELNNPIDQKERFDLQKNLIEKGDAEAMMPDWEFVEMLEYGMPPAFGFGLGGDRLFAFLVDKPLRETQIFPLMRPHDLPAAKKTKETKIAAAVINKGAAMEQWQEMNTVAHLNAEFGARTGKVLFKYPSVETADGASIHLNIQHAIMIKQSKDNADLQKLFHEATEQNLEVAVFTREMLETTNDKKVAEITKGKDLKDIEFLGVLVFGEKSIVDQMTQKFELM